MFNIVSDITHSILYQLRRFYMCYNRISKANIMVQTLSRRLDIYSYSCILVLLQFKFCSSNSCGCNAISFVLNDALLTEIFVFYYDLCYTLFMFRYFFTTIFPNITQALFIYGLFYDSSVHHSYSKPWCLSKHLGFLLYLWIWCCHRCGVTYVTS